MLVLFDKKDTYVPKYEQTACNHYTHFIASIWYDGKNYYCFERFLGNKTTKVYMTNDINNFDFESDYLNTQKSLLLGANLSLSDYNVLMVSKSELENYIGKLKTAVAIKYDSELEAYNDILERIKTASNRYCLSEDLKTHVKKAFHTLWYVDEFGI